MCVIIGDVNKFIGHCLIPLDPWQKLHTKYKYHLEKKRTRNHCTLKIYILPLGMYITFLKRSFSIIRVGSSVRPSVRP